MLIQLYGWTGFDPIASLFIAILIAASVFPLVIDTGRILALDIGDREENIESALSDVVTSSPFVSHRMLIFIAFSFHQLRDLLRTLRLVFGLRMRQPSSVQSASSLHLHERVSIQPVLTVL